MTFRSPKLLKASRDQCCVRCGKTHGVVSAHYTGVRRLKLGGGYGIKVHDFLTADLCQECHQWMDTLSREKESRYGHSEEFFYYIALTWERRFLQGIVVVARKGDTEMASDRVELSAREMDVAPLLSRDTGTDDRAWEGPEAAATDPGAP